MIIDAGNAGISGRFQISKSMGDADGNPIPGTEEVISPWFDNLITDTGLDNVSERFFMRYCSVGSGSSSPSFTDTVLANKVATSSRGSEEEGPHGEDYSSVIGTYTFPQGTAQGNLSEIGVSKTSDGTNLTSRALILDGNGSPTTIVVEDIAILTVTYEWRLYINQTDTLATLMVGGVSRSTVTRPSMIDSGQALKAAKVAGISMIPGHQNGGPSAYSGGLVPISGAVLPTGKRGDADSVDTPAYISGTRYRDTIANWSISSGNGSISTIAPGATADPFLPSIRLQTSFDPPLVKDNTETLSVTHRVTWGRK